MAKEDIGHLKSQEEVNDLMAKLYRAHETKTETKCNRIFFVGESSTGKEEDDENSGDYKERISLALSILKKGYSLFWATEITRLSENTILREYGRETYLKMYNSKNNGK